MGWPYPTYALNCRAGTSACASGSGSTCPAVPPADESYAPAASVAPLQDAPGTYVYVGRDAQNLAALGRLHEKNESFKPFQTSKIASQDASSCSAESLSPIHFGSALKKKRNLQLPVGGGMKRKPVTIVIVGLASLFGPVASSQPNLRDLTEVYLSAP